MSDLQNKKTCCNCKRYIHGRPEKLLSWPHSHGYCSVLKKPVHVSFKACFHWKEMSLDGGKGWWGDV